jgi:hypothetical protein
MSRDTTSRCALVPLGSAAIRSIGGTGHFSRRQTPAKPELGASRQRAQSVESEMGEASPRMPGSATERGPFSPTQWSFSRKRPGAYRETTSSWRGAARSRARLSKRVRAQDVPSAARLHEAKASRLVVPLVPRLIVGRSPGVRNRDRAAGINPSGAPTPTQLPPPPRVERGSRLSLLPVHADDRHPVVRQHIIRHCRLVDCP